MVEGRIEEVSSKPSDLDIGVKPEKPLRVEEKVKIAILCEDLFDVSRVDLIVLPEAPVFLALEIVTERFFTGRIPPTKPNISSTS